jgi:hypothetical protein
MFKRANKMTALFLAAASIITIVPAMAADSTARIESKDGSIENAIAFKDGKYLYKGYKNDQDEALYYSDGTKDIEVEGVKDGEIGDEDNVYPTSFDAQYATIKDGENYYAVNLTNGKIDENITAPDVNHDMAQRKLKDMLNKTERYGDGNYKFKDFRQIKSGAKFGDAWYRYVTEVNTTSAYSTIKPSSASILLYGFADETGFKYEDTDYRTNIYGYSSEKGRAALIGRNSSEYDVDSIYASPEKAPIPLAQDKSYIYALATVDIVDQYTKPTATGEAINGTTTRHYYIEKISKTPKVNQILGAATPSSIACYEILDSDNTLLDDDDAKAAYDAIDEVIGDDVGGVRGLDSYTDPASFSGTFSVADGKLLAIYNDDGKLKVTAIALNKTKDKFESDAKPTNFTNMKDSIDVQVAQAEETDDLSVDSDVDNNQVYDIDVDGNIWAISEGKIYKFDTKTNKFAKVYSVDSAMNQISVYDSNNLIAWEQGGEVYATIGGKGATTAAKTGTTAAATATTSTTAAKTGTTAATTATTSTTAAKTGTTAATTATTNTTAATSTTAATTGTKTGTTTATATTAAAKTGWVKAADGTWNYYEASGKAVSKWINDSGAWYYLKADGSMATGWFKDTDGKWYYLKSNGAMAANETTPDGYYVDASGVWAK